MCCDVAIPMYCCGQDLIPKGWWGKVPLSGLFSLSVHMSCAGREGLVTYNEAVAVAQKSVWQELYVFILQKISLKWQNKNACFV